MSADPPPTDGENITEAIHELIKSVDNLTELLSERLPKQDVPIERVELCTMTTSCARLGLTLVPNALKPLDDGNTWKLFAERR
jgi:hypothetical protein